MRTLLGAVLALLVASSAASAQELTLGSRPGERVELDAVFFAGVIKQRSHFGFAEHGVRNGELAFDGDLGFPDVLPVAGFQLRVSFGELGWLGGELLRFEERGGPEVLRRARIMKGVDLEPGEVLTGRARVLWGGGHYGYDFRVRIVEGLDVTLAPTVGFGFFDVNCWGRRIYPSPTTPLGGQATAWVLAAGAQLSIEVFEIARLGVEAEAGFTGHRFSISVPHMDLWQRIRLYVGVNVYGVDFTVGYRLVGMHLEGDGRGVDLRIPGVDVTLGYRF